MHILVLHSDVPPDAPADEQDTLIAAEAVAEALQSRGHSVTQTPFRPDVRALKKMLGRERPDVVFNLVESVFGAGIYSSLAPAMLARLGVPYTGGTAAHFVATTDKPFAKNLLRAAGLPTPDWSVPPDWTSLAEDRTYIVKSADEDSSVGLDDDCIVKGVDVRARAEESTRHFGGRWFAESYVDGREFNIGVLQEKDGPRILPMAEMTFEEWPSDKPRIVGYTAKWADGSFDYNKTVRRFGVETDEPRLAGTLIDLCRRTWALFELTGYARIDFRMTGAGEPLILEINPNPGIAPDAGFAAAGARAGLSYAELIERIVMAPLP
ncbi:MAG: ATP-grasp domain-containing protein [Alphaproteobacteria bacterium]|nr:ATP-grasp domain-containing protein [Alphaproteobacteria bacterium]